MLSYGGVGFLEGNPQLNRKGAQLEVRPFITAATLVACLLGIILLATGIAFFWKRPAEYQLAGCISLCNMNNLLVIVFAAEFFGPLEPTLAAVYMVPFFGLILPLRFYKNISQNRSATG